MILLRQMLFWHIGHLSNKRTTVPIFKCHYDTGLSILGTNLYILDYPTFDSWVQFGLSSNFPMTVGSSPGVGASGRYKQWCVHRHRTYRKFRYTPGHPFLMLCINFVSFIDPGNNSGMQWKTGGVNTTLWLHRRWCVLQIKTKDASCDWGVRPCP